METLQFFKKGLADKITLYEESRSSVKAKDLTAYEVLWSRVQNKVNIAEWQLQGQWSLWNKNKPGSRDSVAPTETPDNHRSLLFSNNPDFHVSGDLIIDSRVLQ